MEEIRSAEQILSDIAQHREVNKFALSCQFQMHKKEYVSVMELLMETYNNIQVMYAKSEEFYNIIVTIGC